MAKVSTISLKARTDIAAKIRDYKQLVKLRLTILVVFSTAIGFLIASPATLDWTSFTVLLFSSFLIVGASNAINQIIEKDSDKLMTRTANRPLAQNRMSVREAIVASIIMGVSGVIIMGTFLNQFSALLAFAGMIIYGFMYTPLKKITPIAVFVGGISGAIPPLAGYVAASGEIGLLAIVLFSIQFFWQFPHFWAIAWVKNDDYLKAGLKLLPLGSKKDKTSALLICLFTLILIPLSLVPAKLNLVSTTTSIILMVISFGFLWQTIKLYKTLNDKDALKLMFGSFLYLPLVFTLFLLDIRFF